MKQSPNSKFPLLRNPRLWLDPNTIKFAKLYDYVSLDELKMLQSQKNYRKALPYLGGILASCFIIKFLADGWCKKFIFGENANGGEFLKMFTTNTPRDYHYNREFQRMRYMSEEPAGDDPFVATSNAVLADLGVSVENLGHNYQAKKRSPHYKYY